MFTRKSATTVNTNVELDKNALMHMQDMAKSMYTSGLCERDQVVGIYKTAKTIIQCRINDNDLHTLQGVYAENNIPFSVMTEAAVNQCARKYAAVAEGYGVGSRS